MSKLILSTRGMMEIFLINKISLSIVYDGVNFTVNITKRGKRVLQLIASGRFIDSTISDNKDIAPYKQQLRINRLIKNSYKHMISEGIIDGLIPFDIAQRYAQFVDENETMTEWNFDNWFTIKTINERDKVFAEYRLKEIAGCMLGEPDAIRENTTFVAATTDIETNLN